MTTASPRTVLPPKDSAMRLSGWPSKRSRKISDQLTAKAQLLGRSGAMATPAFLRISTQPPSEPSFGQLAPPSASTTASAGTVTCPVGASNMIVTALAPAEPAVAQGKAHAELIEPLQPGAQERRGLQRFRKDPPAGADKGFLSKLPGPGAQSLGGKGLDRGAQARRGRPIAREELIELLAMGEIQPAPPRQQEFPPDRGHPFVNRDIGAAARHDLGGHQARGTHDRDA